MAIGDLLYNSTSGALKYRVAGGALRYKSAPVSFTVTTTGMLRARSLQLAGDTYTLTWDSGLNGYLWGDIYVPGGDNRGKRGIQVTHVGADYVILLWVGGLTAIPTSEVLSTWSRADSPDGSHAFVSRVIGNATYDSDNVTAVSCSGWPFGSMDYDWMATDSSSKFAGNGTDAGGQAAALAAALTSLNADTTAAAAVGNNVAQARYYDMNVPLDTFVSERLAVYAEMEIPLDLTQVQVTIDLRQINSGHKCAGTVRIAVHPTVPGSGATAQSGGVEVYSRSFASSATLGESTHDITSLYSWAVGSVWVSVAVNITTHGGLDGTNWVGLECDLKSAELSVG